MPSLGRGPEWPQGKVDAQRHDLTQGPGRGTLASALTTLIRASGKHTQPTKTPTWVGATSRPRTAAEGDALQCGRPSGAAPGGAWGRSPLPSIPESNRNDGEIVVTSEREWVPPLDRWQGVERACRVSAPCTPKSRRENNLQQTSCWPVPCPHSGQASGHRRARPYSVDTCARVLAGLRSMCITSRLSFAVRNWKNTRRP